MTRPTRTFRNNSWLIPILPVLFFFLHNFNEYKELILTWPIFVVLLAYCLFALLITFVLKRFAKLSQIQAVFVSTICMFFFLLFGDIQDWVSWIPVIYRLGNTIVLSFLMLAIIIFLVVFLKKKKTDASKALRFLAAVCLAVIAVEIFMLGKNVLEGRTIYALTQRMQSNVFEDLPIDTTNKPDIYHIIFDSYASATTLKQYWGYENEITGYLQEKGFYTVDSAFSNYTSTPYSVSSIFNLQYLNGAEPYLISNSPNFYIGQRVYKDNALYKFLRQNGYQFSIFSQMEKESMMLGLGFLGVKPAESWIRKKTFERAYLNPWLTGKLNRFLRKNDDQPEEVMKSMQQFHEHNKQALDHVFTRCRNAATIKGSPLFSFSHIMLPHDPYLLDEQGKFVKDPQPGGLDMQRYLGQVKYCNTLIRQIVDCLLADSTRRKIIIIQGDHGFRHYPSAEPAAAYGALSAVYFPDSNYSGFTKKMSHVNTYRVIMNQYFGTHLSMLKDSIYSYKKP